jgi:hypothetical protein
MKKSLMIAAVTALAVAVPAASAFATPAEFQGFSAGVIGKAGTNAKPKAVALKIHPFHYYGIKGGATNVGNKNTGATMEAPFSTVFANVYMDKALVFNINSFPACDLQTVLDDPDSCDPDSRVDIPSSASGLVRTKGALPGVYSLFTKLEIKTFIMKARTPGGPRVKDTLALRVVTPLVTAVIEGKLGNPTGSAKKLYGKVMRFTIPDGLIAPTDGLVSQLVDFDSGIRAAYYKGKPGIGLGACPKSKKLNFGYNGEYTINATKSKDQKSWKINQTGPRIDKTVPCK